MKIMICDAIFTLTTYPEALSGAQCWVAQTGRFQKYLVGVVGVQNEQELRQYQLLR